MSNRILESVFAAGKLMAALRTIALASLLIATTACTKVDSLFPPFTSGYESSPATKPSAESSRKSLPDFAELVDKEGSTVVNVSASQSVQKPKDAPTQSSGGPAPDFFHHHLPQHNSIQIQSLGSGFMIKADGYILTNAHVVASADHITVTLTDGRDFPAKLIGVDPLTDIALIKINAVGLPIVMIGDPRELRVGEWVAAIGSPFGFENSVTAGIVSGKDRMLPGDGYVPFIQTDVPVNPGNSGGPLFNLKGEVIGMNSQIYSQTGGYMGMSFSIPINVAMQVGEQLRTTGKIIRGRLGVMIEDVPRRLARSLGLANKTGAVIVGVEGGGPADRGGLRAGDIVLKYNQQMIPNSFEMRRLVAATKPGGNVLVEIWRNGQIRVLKLTADELVASNKQ